MEVVYALAPFIHEKGWRLRITGFDPVREESSLICFVPEILIQIGVGDLLEGVNVVHGHKV